MTHTYYEPTEYEQMLIAAHWITPGSVDPDYLAYCRRVKEPMAYDTWQAYKEEWDALDNRYRQEIEPFDRGAMPLPSNLVELQSELLGKMDDIEAELGY